MLAVSLRSGRLTSGTSRWDERTAEGGAIRDVTHKYGIFLRWVFSSLAKNKLATAGENADRILENVTDKLFFMLLFLFRRIYSALYEFKQ